MATLVARQFGSRRHGVSRVQRLASETMWTAEMSSPATLPHPTASARLGLRDGEVATETCGYPVGHDGAAFLTCGGGNICAAWSEDTVVGCCPSDHLNSCTIQTACIELGLVLNLPPSDRRDVGKTLSCGPGVNAYCATYTYAMDDETYDGYSALSCATKNTVITVREFPATDDSTTTSNGPSTTNLASTSSRGLSSSLESSSTFETTTNSSGVPNVATTDPVDNNHQLPVGTIAGSVAGGIVGIALLATGVVFLVLRSRKKNKKGEEQAEKPTAAVPGPTAGGHGESKEMFTTMAAPPMEGAAQFFAGRKPGYPSSLVSPNSYHARSSSIPDDHPVSPVQEDETAATREGRRMPAGKTGGRGYSIHNRPPSSRYHAYNPVSGGPAELPATTVHEME